MYTSLRQISHHLWRLKIHFLGVDGTYDRVVGKIPKIPEDAPKVGFFDRFSSKGHVNNGSNADNVEK